MDETVPKLRFWQKIVFKLRGYVFIKLEKREGWSGYLPIYLVKCKKHGSFLDYRHGYKDTFACPKCFAEETGSNYLGRGKRRLGRCRINVCVLKSNLMV